MFSKHVTKELSAYCHGEVAPDESRQIAEHLIGCNRCRAQFEEIKLGVKLAEHLPQVCGAGLALARSAISPRCGN